MFEYTQAETPFKKLPCWIGLTKENVIMQPGYIDILFNLQLSLIPILKAIHKPPATLFGILQIKNLVLLFQRPPAENSSPAWPRLLPLASWAKRGRSSKLSSEATGDSLLRWRRNEKEE